MALYSTVELLPSDVTGEFVVLIDPLAVPVNAVVFAVLKVPLIIAAGLGGVVPNVIMLFPALMVEFAATVNDLEAADVIV